MSVGNLMENVHLRLKMVENDSTVNLLDHP